MEFLDTSVVQTAITVKTMLRSFTKKSCAIEGLKVRSTNGTTVVDLPKAYNQQIFQWIKMKSQLKNVSSNGLTCMRLLIKSQNLMLMYQLGKIGVSCPTALRPIKVMKEANNGPFAQITVLGWCIIDPITKYNLSSKVVRCNRIAVVNKAEGHIASHHFVVENSVKETDCKQMLLDMYEQEFSEPTPKQMRKKMQPANANGYISLSKHIALSKEDDKFLGKMEKGVTKVDKQYQLPLPFRHENVKMPDNRQQAVQRAMPVRKCFKDQQFYDDYVKFTKNIIEKGYAKEVALLCLKTEEGKVWYLPHHGIYHPKKPDKIRVVFDCSCEYKGRSLNKELLQVPDMTNSLVGVLSKF